MDVSINLSEDIETVLRRTAAVAGTDVGTFVKHVIIERLAEPEAELNILSPEVFAERQAAWVKLHPILDHAIDDSRESFYAGRGE